MECNCIWNESTCAFTSTNTKKLPEESVNAVWKLWILKKKVFSVPSKLLPSHKLNDWSDVFHFPMSSDTVLFHVESCVYACHPKFTLWAVRNLISTVSLANHGHIATVLARVRFVNKAELCDVFNGGHWGGWRVDGLLKKKKKKEESDKRAVSR